MAGKMSSFSSASLINSIESDVIQHAGLRRSPAPSGIIHSSPFGKQLQKALAGLFAKEARCSSNMVIQVQVVHDQGHNYGMIRCPAFPFVYHSVAPGGPCQFELLRKHARHQYSKKLFIWLKNIHHNDVMHDIKPSMLVSWIYATMRHVCQRNVMPIYYLMYVQRKTTVHENYDR